MNPQDAPEILRMSSQRRTFPPPAATAMQILWRGCETRARLDSREHPSRRPAALNWPLDLRGVLT